MNPEIWGPPAWTFLHSVTLAYPDNPSEMDKENYKTFFKSLQPVLPCHKCSMNYLNHINEDPVENHLDTKQSLVKWFIDIHNKVNNSNGKRDYTYDEVMNHYKFLYNGNFSKDYKNKDSNINILTWIFVGLVIGLLLFGLKKYLR